MLLPISLSPDFVAGVSLVVTILVAYFAVFSLSLAVWAFQDSRRRSRNWLAHALAGLLVLALNLPGVLLYMLLRPGETMAQKYERSLEEAAILQDLEKQLACPNCKRAVQPEFVICPHCTTQLRVACVKCGAALSALWRACPFCTTPVAHAGASGPSRTREPLADTAPVPPVPDAVT